MRDWVFRVGAIAVLMAGPLCAQQPQAVSKAGVWQGTFVADGEKHRAVLQMEKTEGGGWKAGAFYVEFIHDDMQIDSPAVNGANGSVVKFSTNGGKGLYEGKMSPDGASIAGTWTWDKHAAELDLKSATMEAAWKVPFQYQYHLRDVTYLRPSPEEAKIAFTPQLAVDYMEQGARAWTADWKCVACHTNGSYMVVRPLMTGQLGQPSKELHDFFLQSLKEELAIDPEDQRPELDSTQAVYIAAGLAIWDAHVTYRLSAETVQSLDMMFKLQRADGDWTISDDNNPPLESNRYQLATVAARAVGNAPEWLAARRGTPVESKVKLLENYLRAAKKLQGDYDLADLLWASTELPGLIDDARKEQLIEMILSHQRADGGWSIREFARPEEWGKGNRAEKLRAELEYGHPQSDGHMTGLAIIALREAGVPATDARIKRGVAWLLRNQRSSGRWWTRSLNRDGWQFISYSGTVYPLLALSLCDALPGSRMEPSRGN